MEYEQFRTSMDGAEKHLNSQIPFNMISNDDGHYNVMVSIKDRKEVGWFEHLFFTSLKSAYYLKFLEIIKEHIMTHPDLLLHSIKVFKAECIYFHRFSPLDNQKYSLKKQLQSI